MTSTGPSSPATCLTSRHGRSGIRGRERAACDFYRIVASVHHTTGAADSGKVSFRRIDYLINTYNVDTCSVRSPIRWFRRMYGFHRARNLRSVGAHAGQD